MSFVSRSPSAGLTIVGAPDPHRKDVLAQAGAEPVVLSSAARTGCEHRRHRGETDGYRYVLTRFR